MTGAAVPRNAGLLRRLGAIAYDATLVLALMFVGTVPFVALRGGEFVRPGSPVYQLTLLLIGWAFFAGFWHRSGRTLGMQTWRIRIESADGGPPSLTQCTLRYVGAIVSWLPFGLGFLWQLVDADGLSWHDRLSGTRLVVQPKD